MVLYKRIFLFLLKWFATIYVIISGAGNLFAVIDIVFDAGWGYPWWSTFLILLAFGVGLLVRYCAAAALQDLKS